MVDANGKEIPWVDRDGRILETVSERYRPAPGQKFFLDLGREYDYRGPLLIPDWREQVRKGEFALPIYADLPSMPEHERRVIFGLMVSQAGKYAGRKAADYAMGAGEPVIDRKQVEAEKARVYAPLQ